MSASNCSSDEFAVWGSRIDSQGGIFEQARGGKSEHKASDVRGAAHTAGLHVGHRANAAEDLDEEPHSDQKRRRKHGHAHEPADHQERANLIVRIPDLDSA